MSHLVFILKFQMKKTTKIRFVIVIMNQLYKLTLFEFLRHTICERNKLLIFFIVMSYILYFKH